MHKAEFATLIVWAKDSIWRFMPPVAVPDLGYVPHPVDFAVNKVLALAVRDELCDWVVKLYLYRELISLGALVFATVGKHPGLNPDMFPELLARKAQSHPRDLDRLQFVHEPDLPELRREWGSVAEGKGICGDTSRQGSWLFVSGSKKWKIFHSRTGSRLSFARGITGRCHSPDLRRIF